MKKFEIDQYEDQCKRKYFVNKRYGVIDFIKGIAMIAVFTNHLDDVYRFKLFKHNIFSVSLLIICAGITSAISSPVK